MSNIEQTEPAGSEAGEHGLELQQGALWQAVTVLYGCQLETSREPMRTLTGEVSLITRKESHHPVISQAP